MNKPFVPSCLRVNHLPDVRKTIESSTGNPVEFDGINPVCDNGEFAIIRGQAGVNSVLVRQGLPAPDRLLRLNEIAITQMRTRLTEPNLKRLKA